jgi:CHASE3 domain sensor protein
MAALPAYDISQLVTKEEFRAGLAELRTEFKTDLQQGLRAVNQRIDRLFMTMVAGQTVILSAIIGLAFLP